nr:phospholipid carrier-dependent glycosyltransferase [Cellulomonas sp. KRMCY2]
MTTIAADRRRGTPARTRLAGWLGALGVTGLAAALRLPGLDRIPTLVFDETYYVKDAWTLLRLGYEAAWGDDPNPAFEAGDVDGYSDRASYVVHPPVGKHLVGLGMRLLGAQDPVGWRLGAALAGIVSVLLLTRIARRLFASTSLGLVAGLLLAVDGSAIVHSRTSLLDGFLMMFVLAAFGALLIDRDRARQRMLGSTAPPRAPGRWGPGLGLRPWRLAAGVLLGLAVGTKWSGLWFLAAFGLLTVGWDASTRYRAGVRRWWQAALLRDAGPAFVSLVPVAALTYLASWFSWFRSPDAYDRSWAQAHPGQGVTWLPDALRSLVRFHQEMWDFHTGLTDDHSYASHPITWIVQWRPTAFFYVSPEPAQQICGADRCSQTVTSLGNPVLWLLAAFAVLACLWWAVRRRDGVAAAVLTGIAAGWLPWFAFPQRTIFAFYAVAFLPWLVLAVTWSGARLLAWGDADEARRRIVRTVVVVVAVAVLATSWYFYPLWTGQVTTFRTWQLHQWLPSWV